MTKNVDNFVVYIKPTCTTCKKALKKLTEKGIDHRSVNYYKDKLTKKKIGELIDKLDVEPEEIMRKRDKAYKELGLAKKQLTKSEIVDLLYDNPDLVQRPIIEKGQKAYLLRPVDKLDDIL